MTITDLALIEYFTRAGFIKVALRKGWRPMLGGSIISYRRAASISAWIETERLMSV